ncbi:MAG: transposase [Chloroflexi bacterium]|nr:transposase [Chloroflexota bacterium]MDA1271511.1 transposase [Chloroflexota bacterium]
MHQYIGVDVASGTLEVAAARQKKTKRFPNTPGGISDLRLWLDRFGSLTGLHLVVEPTSTYHHHLVESMAQWGVPYTLINPANTAAFARVQGLRAKTDPVDARLLAAYGESQQPAPSPHPEQDQESLKSLRRHREWLEKERRAAGNRLETAARSPWTSPSVLESLKRTMEGLDEELGRIAAEEERELTEKPGWSQEVSWLGTIPGIGKKTAMMIVSELPPVSRCTRSK